MAARHTPSQSGRVRSRPELEALLRDSGGGAPRWWSNGPGDTYGRHAHPSRKVLFCRSGSITFHTDDGDVTLAPGDRLELDPGTVHAASVGPEGCECVEAWA